jgi:hypothetical protein
MSTMIAMRWDAQSGPVESWKVNVEGSDLVATLVGVTGGDYELHLGTVEDATAVEFHCGVGYTKAQAFTWAEDIISRYIRAFS